MRWPGLPWLRSARVFRFGEPMRTGRSTIPGCKENARKLPLRGFYSEPVLALAINWANTAPGYSWPESYYVSWIPYYDRYLVTASLDSPLNEGYLDLAIGALPDKATVEGDLKEVIQGRWYDLFPYVQGWEECLNDGIVEDPWAWRPSFGLMRRADNERVFFHSRIRGISNARALFPSRSWKKPTVFMSEGGLLFCRRSRKPVSEIYYDGQVLHLGEPEMRPEVPTWREYLLKYEGYTQKDLKKPTFAKSPLRLTTRIWTRMCCEYFCDQWAHNHDPAAEFAHFIDGLSIGVENPKAAKILGSLKRHEGSFTLRAGRQGDLYVTFDEPITLSWLPIGGLCMQRANRATILPP